MTTTWLYRSAENPATDPGAGVEVFTANEEGLLSLRRGRALALRKVTQVLIRTLDDREGTWLPAPESAQRVEIAVRRAEASAIEVSLNDKPFFRFQRCSEHATHPLRGKENSTELPPHITLCGINSLAFAPFFLGLTNLISLDITQGRAVPLDQSAALAQEDHALRDNSRSRGATTLKTLRLRMCTHNGEPSRVLLGGLTELRVLSIEHIAELKVLEIPDSLQKLESLTIRSCDSLCSLHVRGPSSSLGIIEISSCSRLEHLEINAFEALEWLEIDDCERLPSVPELSGLRSLRGLRIEGCAAVRHLPPLHALQSLERLRIWDCNALDCLPDLANLASLTEAEIGRCEYVHAWPSVRNLPRIRALHLEACPRLDGPVSFAEAQTLESIRIVDCARLCSLDELGRCRGLKELAVRGCPRLNVLVDLSAVPDLTSLELVHCGLERLDGIASLTNLRRLRVQGCVLENFPDLSGHTELEELRLDLNPRQIVVLMRSVGKLSKLKHLDLATAIDLRDVFTSAQTRRRGKRVSLNLRTLTHLETLCLRFDSSDVAAYSVEQIGPQCKLHTMRLSGLNNQQLLGLKNLQTLRQLEIAWCCVDYLDLSGLESLESLVVRSCNRLKSPPAVRDCRSLRSVVLDRCEQIFDLSPLWECATLESIELIGCGRLTHRPEFRPPSNLRTLKGVAPHIAVQLLARAAALRSDSAYIEAMLSIWLTDLEGCAAEDRDSAVVSLLETASTLAGGGGDEAANVLRKTVYAALDLRTLLSLDACCALLRALRRVGVECLRRELGRLKPLMNTPQPARDTWLQAVLCTFPELTSTPDEAQILADHAEEFLSARSGDELTRFGILPLLCFHRLGADAYYERWLPKLLTSPDTIDRLSAEIALSELARSRLSEALRVSERISSPSERDRVLQALIPALAQRDPWEAGRLLEKLSSTAIKTEVARKLAHNAAFTAVDENALRLLIILEADPTELLAFFRILLAQHPGSAVAKALAAAIQSEAHSSGGVSATVRQSAGTADSRIGTFQDELAKLLDSSILCDLVAPAALRNYRAQLFASPQMVRSILRRGLVQELGQRGLLGADDAAKVLDAD